MASTQTADREQVEEAPVREFTLFPKLPVGECDCGDPAHSELECDGHMILNLPFILPQKYMLTTILLQSCVYEFGILPYLDPEQSP
jgi:hypothetical protein